MILIIRGDTTSVAFGQNLGKLLAKETKPLTEWNAALQQEATSSGEYSSRRKKQDRDQYDHSDRVLISGRNWHSRERFNKTNCRERDKFRNYKFNKRRTLLPAIVAVVALSSPTAAR
jgi:hypothetical protein